ncbi:fasciclin domain-containing protein [Rhodococcus sp. HNM0569]|uniref:fasciclin domain-containing protein n=1 Tax=Rhodococcus sp. HNM0569 TaxID=2716340 RepID=UPI00146AD2E0|nr:fasciclin domain-containing protein [Rhodococcus sp. HNM0569]NLU83843.1 fasciclin domain-containing protein [Rhodococcus sp. HNM0569]
MITKNRTAAATALAAVALLGISACSSDDSGESDTMQSGARESDSMQTDSMQSGSMQSGSMAEPANLVGPGCTTYAEQVPDGPGSVDGMAQDPVTVAASNNPMLTTLTQAVSGQLNPDVDLVDTLNGGEFTVFAPVDSAFDKIDPATLDSLKTDSAMLNSILTYHVVPGRLSPDQVAGMHPTAEGADLDVTGSGDDLTVDDSAKVVCGGVRTANATVYLIDSVLMPPMQ